MYESDGISLTGSEHATLRALVELERSGERPECGERMALVIDPENPTERANFKSLAEKGLLVDTSTFGHDGAVEGTTQLGRDWVDDYDATIAVAQAAERKREEAERDRIRRQHIHDYRVALLGILGGAAAGAAASVILHFTLGL